MTRDEEMMLIKSVLGGNKDDFEQLVIANQSLIYNLALKMVGNPDDAFDISQDAFIKAYNSLESFKAESKFSVWLYRLTSNICLDFLRAKKRKNVISLSMYNTEDEPLELEISDTRYSPETEFEKKELSQALGRGLEQLPEEHREVLLLREIDGLSYDEISKSLNIEAGTVKSRIFRARKKLCNILAKDGNFSGFTSSKR